MEVDSDKGLEPVDERSLGVADLAVNTPFG
jgi:hypothetical protein